MEQEQGAGAAVADDPPEGASALAPGTALEPVSRQEAMLGVGIAPRADLITDDEMRRMYRLAEALHLSGAFGDVKRAETAFAKMVIGRDLGLTPMQSMQGLHLVEGGVSVHYATLGHFVRSRPGYNYRAGWLKEEAEIVLEGSEPSLPVTVVWMDEEEAADLRTIVGAVVEFTVDGKRIGVSRFTVDDARTAGLIKDSPKAAWNTARRNMLLARSMSNGVKWFVPEVLGGLPVYTTGELETAKAPSLTEGTGGGSDEGQGIDLGPKVDAIIARAQEMGHAGLSNRGAIELGLGNRAPAVVDKWVRDAAAELDKMAAEQREQEDPEAEAERPTPEPDAPEEAPTAEPEPVEVEIVDEPAPEDPNAGDAPAEPEPEPADPNDEDAAKGLADPIPTPPVDPVAQDMANKPEPEEQA